MKKSVLVMLFALTGCIDIIHYVSFNHEGQTVVSVQTSFPSALLGMDDFDEEDLKTKISGLMPAGITADPNIKASNMIVNNLASYGVQVRYTAPKNYLAKAQDFFPVKEPYGFSLAVGALRKSASSGEIGEDMDNEMASVMIKYRILLSKASLPRPLMKAVLSPVKGKKSVEAPITDYGAIYMVEIPIKLILEEEMEKVEFHFSS